MLPWQNQNLREREREREKQNMNPVADRPLDEKFGISSKLHLESKSSA
jgi:hypothetical protein